MKYELSFTVLWPQIRNNGSMFRTLSEQPGLTHKVATLKTNQIATSDNISLLVISEKSNKDVTESSSCVYSTDILGVAVD